MNRFMRVLACLLGVALSVSPVAAAGPVIWINDSNGGLRKVDISTNTVTVIGSTSTILTDIAFDPSGNLYGMSFNQLFTVNTTTAALTLKGNHGIVTGNALTFKSDGTLYAAGNQATTLYKLNPLTGANTALAGNMGTSSAGDLAYYNGQLYLAGSNNKLVALNDSTGTGTAVGNFGVTNVFGLATATSNGVLYAIAGTKIYTVNVNTGAATQILDYSGKGLFSANGAAFIDEAVVTVPEPATMAMLGIGLAGMAGYGWRRKKQAPALS